MRTINSDRYNILFFPVIVFFAVTGFCVLFSEQGSVVWSIFSKHIKDILIVWLLLITLKNSNDYRDKISAMGIVSYFISSLSLRLGCAINSDFNYEIYRQAINSPMIGNLANSIIFMLSLLIITTYEKHE